MAKSVDAFRTISEVAEWLEVPPHVLRFWESKFTQVKPVKRAGGRRYYRPADMLLLGGIKVLLHDEGMTIKGVQKLLVEQGARHVSDRSPALDDLTGGAVADMVIDATAATETYAEAPPGIWSEAPGAPTADGGNGDAPEHRTPAPDREASRLAPHPPAPETAPETAAETMPEPETAEPPATLPPAAPPRRVEETEASSPPGPPPMPPLPPMPDLPADPPDDLPANPGPLAALARLRQPLTPDDAARLAPFIDRLRHLAEARTHGRGDRN